MKAQIKNLVNKTNNYNYHRKHKRIAEKILKDIEGEKGKTPRRIIKLADDYASEILGWRGYAPWLYVYSAINEKFLDGWIPDNYYGKIVVPALKGDQGKISDMKSFTQKIFNSSYFPDIAFHINGLWFNYKYEVIKEEIVEKIIFRHNTHTVYKIDNSVQGKGVYFFNKNNFDLNKVKKLGNGVFQKLIIQHPFFQEIMPSSVATLRVTTVVDDSGSISVRSCYLRVGRKFETHVQSHSHIRIPVNVKSGKFEKYGYLNNWSSIEKHPDTNVLFSELQLPRFQSLISTAKHLHSTQPFVRCIGWDMIIDIDENVQVMEYNGNHNDIKFSEATQGPCFSDLNWERLWQK
ncbi:sugar-transfer associated ATP-grasp domain-containing protein [Salinimicrobium xinjiangense]|uniref:sugar-transfer associated ATP-grasp domain-containing protein n=1 Tax=Salinimicrobium xinjiangense TaxID=438596 RepID=UPI0004125A82|nr:sugar-transfer associated ATP-grasp domain-containing protein [Salinimicrobium xinjiangense]